jgi:hypothetical protein
MTYWLFAATVALGGLVAVAAQFRASIAARKRRLAVLDLFADREMIKRRDQHMDAEAADYFASLIYQPVGIDMDQAIARGIAITSIAQRGI